MSYEMWSARRALAHQRTMTHTALSGLVAIVLFMAGAAALCVVILADPATQRFFG